MGNADKEKGGRINSKINRILKLCDEFLKIPSITRYEKPFLDYLEKKFNELDYMCIKNKSYLVIKRKSSTSNLNSNDDDNSNSNFQSINNNNNNLDNNLGNNNNNKYLFSIHIDRHGLIKNKNNEIEYLIYNLKKKYKLLFKNDDREFFENCALRHTKENISSYDWKSGKIINKYQTIRNNLDSKNKLVTFNLNKELGKNEELFMFNSKININKNQNIFSAQIDNVISVAVIFYILENTKKFPHEIIFTCEEEIGYSYKYVMNYLKSQKIMNNQNIITLDTSPYENFKNKKKGFIVLREGDKNGIFNIDLVNKIKRKLETLDIPYYFKASNMGSTELGKISNQSKKEYNGATIQLPSMNYHSSYETSSIESLENYLKIIKEFIK